MIRWGVYCPFSKSVHTELDGRVEINMFSQANQLHNPVNRLVYQRPNTNMQDEMSSRTASGKITFDIRRGNNVSNLNFYATLLLISSFLFLVGKCKAVL